MKTKSIPDNEALFTDLNKYTDPLPEEFEFGNNGLKTCFTQRDEQLVHILYNGQVKDKFLACSE